MLEHGEEGMHPPVVAERVNVIIDRDQASPVVFAILAEQVCVYATKDPRQILCQNQIKGASGNRLLSSR